MFKTPWNAAEEVLKVLRDIHSLLREVVTELQGVRVDIKELRDSLKTRPK